MKSISNTDHDSLCRLLPVLLNLVQERRTELSLRELNAARLLSRICARLDKNQQKQRKNG